MNEILYHAFDRSYFCEERYVSEILSSLDLMVDNCSFVVTSDLHQLPKTKYPAIVVLTGDEKEQLADDPFPGQNPRAVFRIFNRALTCDLAAVFPIPCGYNWRMHNDEPSTMERFYPEVPLSQRQHDLFFAGQVIESRRELVRRLKSLSTRFRAVIGTNSSFRTGLKIDDYLRQLGQAKIALVPDGTSPDTFRYVEALASGCIVIMPRKTDLWYYRDAPVVWINDWTELNAQLIESILSQDLDEWGRRSVAYYHEVLSGPAVAKYIAQQLANQSTLGYLNSLARHWHSEVLEARRRVSALENSRDYRWGAVFWGALRAVKRFVIGRR